LPAVIRSFLQNNYTESTRV